MRKSRADRDISYRTLPEGNVTVKTDNGIFAGSRERYGSAARYIIAGGMTTAVNFAVFALFFEIFGMSVTASNIISVAAAVIFAYIVNKLYVFRSRCPDMQTLSLIHIFCSDLLIRRVIPPALPPELGIIYDLLSLS